MLKLYDLLYSADEMLPLPSFDMPSCTYKMAVTCLWLHIQKKALVDTPSSQNAAMAKERHALQRQVPRSIAKQIE